MPTSVYLSKDGTILPGTTTICSRFKESGGLLWWAHKLGYKQGLARERAQLYEARDRAGDIGTAVHALVQWHIDGETEAKPELNIPNKDDWARVQNGYEQFLRWQDRTRLFIVSWEKPLISELYRFGGTPDALFEHSNAIAMGDWKTASGVYVDNLLQVGGGYVLLWEENFPDRPLEDEIHIVRFSKDFGDIEHRTFSDLSVMKRQFLRLRQAYDDDRLLSQRVK